MPNRSDHAPQPVHFSDSVELAGVLPRCRHIGRSELLAMPATAAGPLHVECYSGRRIRTVSRLRGVLVTDLLDLAGMPALPRSQAKQLVIAVQAGDGYACLFSWHELYNSPIGEGAMLVVEQDGVELPDAAGGLQLMSLRDRRLGPRQAIAVQRISVWPWQRPAT